MRRLPVLLLGLLSTLVPAGALAQSEAPPPGLQAARARGPVVSGEQQREWREAAADPQTGEVEVLLASRSMLWLGRSPRSRLRVGLGLEQRGYPPGAYPTPYASPAHLQGQIWGGLRLQLAGDLSWSVETPLWEQDEGRRGGLRFERPRGEGVSSLRNALRYKLGPDSQLVIKPRRSKFSVTYTASW